MAQKIQRFEMRLSPEQDKDLLEYMDVFIAQSERFGGTRSGVLKSMANYFMEKHPNGLIDTLNDMTDDVVTVKKTEKAKPVDEPEKTESQAEETTTVSDEQVVKETIEPKSQEVPNTSENSNKLEQEKISTNPATKGTVKSIPTDEQTLTDKIDEKKGETSDLSLSDQSLGDDSELAIIKSAKKKNLDLFANSTFQTK